MIKKRLSYKLFNPNYWHIRKAMKDATIRYIIAYGGSSSSKSYSVAQAILVDMINSGDNTLVMRKVDSTIKKTIYNTFVLCTKMFKYRDSDGYKTPMFICQEGKIICTSNDAYISFSGIDDPEKIKGIESYKRVVLEELSEFDEEDFDQVKIRLRGKVGQQLICMFNPISELHWIKKNVIDKEKLIEQPVYVDGITAYKNDKPFKLTREYTSVTSKWINSPKKLWNDRIKDYEDYPPDMVIIKSTYLNNFWVNLSPCGSYGNYDRQTISNYDDMKANKFTYYQIYALGEWGTIKTGGEFLPGFDLNKHVKQCTYNSSLPIHISIDNNVLPYITATFFQTVDNKVYQIHEICAEEPNNTATQAAGLAVDYLNEIGYDDIIILYGDATTKAKNTIDDNKLSFFDKYKSVLELSYVVTEKVQSSNPSVSLSGEFVNEILKGTQGIEFCVDPNCTNSINDYVNAKKDENGGMLKKRVKNKLTGQTYEELGHLCLSGNTLIDTINGKSKIKDIQIGDYVLTRNGYSYVYNSIMTKHDSKVYCYDFNNEKVICTEDHKVFVNGYFTEAKNIKQGDIIIKNKNGILCKEKLKHITALDLIGILIQNEKVIEDTLRDGLLLTAKELKYQFTDIHGLKIMELFLKATIYITLMAISIIIQLITCSYYLLKSIMLYMKKIFQKKLKSNVCELLKKLVYMLLNGIKVKKEKNGIVNTLLLNIKKENTKYLTALIAGKNIYQKVTEILDFVLTIAKVRIEELQKLIMKSVYARFVEKNLNAINILEKILVQKNVLQYIGSNCDVYDISVNDREFFANNILMHNCDTFRYYLVMCFNKQYNQFSNKRKRNKIQEDDMKYFKELPDKCETIMIVAPIVNDKFGYVVTSLSNNDIFINDAYVGNFIEPKELINISSIYKPSLIQVNSLKPDYLFALRELIEDIDVIGKKSNISDDKINANLSRINEFKFKFDYDNYTEYSEFVNNLLDYKKGGSNEAATILTYLSEYLLSNK